MDSATWTACVTKLQDLYSDEEILTWIEPVQPRAHEDTLTLFCPNEHVVYAVQEQYKDSILEALPRRFEKVVVRVGSVAANEPSGLPVPVAMPSAPTGNRELKKGSWKQESQPEVVRAEGLLPASWSEAQRGLSNHFARSALFTANRYGLDTERPFHRHRKVRSPSNVEILYTGEELNQFDQEVHMQLLHYQRNHPVGEPIQFSLRSVVRDLGLPESGQNTSKVRKALERLKNAQIDLQGKGQGSKTLHYSDNLIANFRSETDAGDSQWAVRFSKELLSVMSYESISFINLEIDRQLRSELATYMHRFLSTHRYPLPYKLETYYELCGSRIATLRRFRRSMREALDELVKVGFLEHAVIDDDDKVHVIRADLRLLGSDA